MKHPRFSIGRLMGVVGIVALNLWAGRILFSIEPWILAGAAPIGLILEFAVYRLIRSRGLARAFWAGFLATGFLAAGSLFWGLTFHESLNMGINVITGERMTISNPGFASSCRAWNVWAEYLKFVADRLERLPLTRGISTRDGAPQFIAGTVIVFLPQLLIALAGGLLAFLLASLLGLLPRGELTLAPISLLE